MVSRFVVDLLVEKVYRSEPRGIPAWWNGLLSGERLWSDEARQRIAGVTEEVVAVYRGTRPPSEATANLRRLGFSSHTPNNDGLRRPVSIGR